MRTVVVAGTGTDVGKTWVTANLARRLRDRGATVCARKPVQSFEEDSSEPTDAEVLALATGERPAAICPPHRWLGVPMAPPIAAAVLDQPIPQLHQLCDEIVWPDPPPDIGFIESVGGVRSPLADGGDTVDLVQAINPDLVLVVADAALGAINNVRLAANALSPAPTVVFLNRFKVESDLHRYNLAWLCERDGLDVQTELDELVELLITR